MGNEYCKTFNAIVGILNDSTALTPFEKHGIISNLEAIYRLSVLEEVQEAWKQKDLEK